MTTPTRLLVCGHANSATGFARVLHSLLHHLPDGYSIHHLGSNVSEDEAHEASLDPVADRVAPKHDQRVAGTRHWRVHANPRTDQAQAQDELGRLACQIEPQILLVLDEPWAAAVYRPLVQSLPSSCKSLLYAAIDGADSCTAEHLEQLQDFDSLVLFNEFGRGIVEHSARNLAPGTPVPPLRVIPHGIDSALFHPLHPDDGSGRFAAARLDARQQLFGHAVGPEAFIVLNANRNQPNKRIDLTVRGFARFAAGKPPDVKLYLHMGTAQPAPGQEPLIDRLNLRARLLTTSQTRQHPKLTSQQLNLVYNACDVGINTSEGEGWGLIAFEHGATGGAQIVPDHSACRELWQDSALLLATADQDRVEGYQRQRRTVKISAVAEALERLYRNPALRYSKGLAAQRNASRPELAWRAIAKLWNEHFQQLLGSRAGK